MITYNQERFIAQAIELELDVALPPEILDTEEELPVLRGMGTDQSLLIELLHV